MNDNETYDLVVECKYVFLNVFAKLRQCPRESLLPLVPLQLYLDHR